MKNLKNLKKSIALVCSLLLLLALTPAAFAELNGAAPDAEYLNPETDGRAEIYDVAGLFSEEERKAIQGISEKVIEGIKNYSTIGPDRAMNFLNTRPENGAKQALDTEN